jgi:dienelactone hydrolase
VESRARRLRAATDWVRAQPATKGLAFGYFGASTGAAAALIAAVGDPEVAAVVSGGGRPDIAAPVWRASRPRRFSSWAGRMCP